MLWGLLFGSVGLGYFIYGKKQRNGLALSCGIGLMVCPYLVANDVVLVLLCAGLMALPYFIRI